MSLVMPKSRDGAALRENVLRTLRAHFPGGYHYVDEMTWGTCGHVWYAMASAHGYYVHAKSLGELEDKIRKKISTKNGVDWDGNQ
jgi:hypothetical protein